MRHQIDPTIAEVASLMMPLAVLLMVAIYANSKLGKRSARAPEGSGEP